MSGALDPRVLVRELGFAISGLLPFARAGAAGQTDGVEALAFGRSIMAATKMVDGLPWQALLEASTRHLREEERQALQDGESPCPFALCMSNDHSWFLRLEADDGAPALGPGLDALAIYCRSRGFRYVRLDDDAPCLPGLPLRSE